ncbi:protein Niban 2-like [Mugil cephalus]|uniref:protein Niban 2-like n=1 Tax=Mugil cephalus TaxID=48193 RepID=UPI001FB685AF|nr:protein Niban 2-like [Mugil cephalus]
MGGSLTSHLNAKEHKYISEHIADTLENLTPLYQHHYCSNLLTHLRNKHTEPIEPRPLIQHADVITHAGIVLEATLPQYLNGVWTHRHVQVTNNFEVESREASEVFEGGWGCKTEFVLSGCHICTSIHEHCGLVDDMCRHITGKSEDKLACWDCPTEFPVFIQHPYMAPVCLATASSKEQAQWANILRAATQHQSSALWCKDSPESRAFLEAVSSLKKLRKNNKSEVPPVGNEEEVVISIVMEEIVYYLKEQVFPRITACRNKQRKTWIRLLSEVYRTTEHQVKAAMVVLKEELSRYQSDVEKKITAGLQQTSLLQDHITHTISEDTCEMLLHSLLHTIIPRLDRTLQEVATPICNGFASTWKYFLETCDDIIEIGPTSTSATNVNKEVLSALRGLGPDNARMWKCLDRLELTSKSREWLQDTWGVHSGTWRPLLLKAQNALYKVVDMCAVMFGRLVSRYPCFSSDSSQLTAVLCKVKDRVLKHLETEMLALRSHLILEMILQIALPTFAQDVNAQDLSRYKAMIDPEHAFFIHPDTIFNSILRDNLTSYIKSEMRYSLPQKFVTLPVGVKDLCSPGVPKPSHYEHLHPSDCRQKSSQISEDSSSESETLIPSTVSNEEDTLTNSENHILSLLDAGENIHLTESRMNYSDQA